MNRIVSTSKVRGRLSLKDDDGINEAIESARDAALIHVASLIGFVREQSVVVDTFYIDSRREKSMDGLYSLRLSSGFVAATPALEMKVGNSLPDLATASVEDSGTYLLRAEKGVLRVPETLSEKYIQITYTAGIADEDDAPDWLVEAMIGYTIKVMSQQQIQDGKQEITKVIPALERHLTPIMDSHLRGNSMSVKPLV